MKALRVLAFVSLSVWIAYAQGSYWGTAAVDDPMGMHKNPGYLGLGHGLESAIFGSFTTDSIPVVDIKNTHGILLNLEGLAGGYENIGGMKRWTTGMGFGDRTFGLGYLRTWTAHDSWGGGWRNGWIFGAIARPWDFVSAGWSYEDSPAMEGHRMGIALRPKTWRVTVFGDVLKENEADWEDIDWGVGGELHLVDGIRLFGRYDYLGKDNSGNTDDQISIGLRIDHPFGGTGAVASQGFDAETPEYLLYSVSSIKELPSIFKQPKHSLQLDLSGDYAERPQAGLFSGKKRAFSGLLRALERAIDDDRVEALVIKYRNPSLNFAQTEELRDVLKSFKDAGKPIFLYADNLGNLSYYLASVADYIAIPPGCSGVGIIGLGSEMMFFRGALDKVGVEPDFVSIGEYKSAMEMFTNTGPSEPLAENMNEILDGFEKEFLGKIAEGRGISIERAKELVDKGPYTDIESDTLGLVDSLMYWDQFEKFINDEKKLKTKSFASYSNQKTREVHWGEPDKIAVIVIEGSIVKGSGGSGGLFGGSSVGESEIISAVNAAKKDKAVKGILLRINSGGGSALASDLMAHALSDAAEKKPLVVSMAGSAASGGYLVAMPGTKIFADRITVTGSIGVISGKIALRGLYDKIGISTARFERGENSAIYSTVDLFTPAQRERIRSSSLRIYDVFKDWVADGRGISVDSVDVLGRGRIYTGVQAFEVGLVDSVGGFLDALDYLVEETCADRKDLKLVFMPGSSPWTDNMLDMMSMRIPILRDLKQITAYPFEDSEALYLMPFTVEVK